GHGGDGRRHEQRDRSGHHGRHDHGHDGEPRHGSRHDPGPAAFLRCHTTSQPASRRRPHQGNPRRPPESPRCRVPHRTGAPPRPAAGPCPVSGITRRKVTCGAKRLVFADGTPYGETRDRRGGHEPCTSEVPGCGLSIGRARGPPRPRPPLPASSSLLHARSPSPAPCRRCVSAPCRRSHRRPIPPARKHAPSQSSPAKDGPRMSNEVHQLILEEVRANGGQVGGPFAGARLILPTTSGAGSGARDTTPVAGLPGGGGRILVIASAGGSPRHPEWYHNLVANPEVTVETGVFTYRARATVLTGEERDRAFARAVETDPGGRSTRPKRRDASSPWSPWRRSPRRRRRPRARSARRSS